ncbi:hypothetical protein SLEP1_g48908 [Rubroshorea leprosula]|uniref:CCHC-type domain-containing protein n=1 Tax=Rubroshorea leprosula TaxID=152421 RepID=A0AAV5LXG8_9ROSI|nr:hypothetical protein SLEP1_g48908 [Rubroshorea leprosula]
MQMGNEEHAIDVNYLDEEDAIISKGCIFKIPGLDAALEETKLVEMKDTNWNTIQKKAASQIWLALAPKVKYNVLLETTPIGMWRKLEEIYASKSLTNRLCLKMELYQLKMVEGTNIHKNLFDFNMMVTQVVNAEDILEEEEKALLLLASLPKSYKSLVQSMLVGKTTLVMKDVTTMLLENDKFFKEDDCANQNNALVMEQSWGRSYGRGGGGNRERSKSRPKKDYGEVQCFYCSELGHKQYKCLKFKEDFSNMNILMKSQETKGKGEANIVEENVVEVLAYEECDLEGELGEITVATGEKVNIEGIGDVRLNVHNGRVKILEWYKYVGKQEWCKVYKGGRLVLHGRKNKHNTYVLEQHPEKGLNKTMRKMVWKPKGILVDGREINKTKKKVSFNNKVVFDDGLRRLIFHFPNPVAKMKELEEAINEAHSKARESYEGDDVMRLRMFAREIRIFKRELLMLPKKILTKCCHLMVVLLSSCFGRLLERVSGKKATLVELAIGFFGSTFSQDQPQILVELLSNSSNSLKSVALSFNGPAAYDVLSNFEEHWMKGADP